MFETATIVGPRVIVTAAHCANTGATATFKFNGANYSATITRSPDYQGKDHDGYVPDLDCIGGGDYLEFSLCMDCGKILGDFPVSEENIERALND